MNGVSEFDDIYARLLPTDRAAARRAKIIALLKVSPTLSQLRAVAGDRLHLVDQEIEDWVDRAIEFREDGAMRLRLEDEA